VSASGGLRTLDPPTHTSLPPVTKSWRRHKPTSLELRDNYPPLSFVPDKKGKCSPYSITERRVPELIPVLGSQPAGDVSHKLDGRLPLLSARPTVTPATLKSAAINFAAW